MVVAVGLERVYVGSDGDDVYVSTVPSGGEIVIEFDPSSYSAAVDGPAICRVIVPNGHPARGLPADGWAAFVREQVAAAWPTMQVGARIAYRRLARRRRSTIDTELASRPGTLMTRDDAIERGP